MRVATVGPIPPEVQAYTLARYSRSADNIDQSLAWVKSHDSGKFLEDFYFKYGHGSIADLGHVTLSLEGISNIASIEVEDEPLWDGQEKSTRFQDFSNAEPVIPSDMNAQQRQGYCDTFSDLLWAYRSVHSQVLDGMRKETQRPLEMKADDYDRVINARAFDVARYLLPMGIQTNVGQVVSIRTLEKQIRRLMASPYTECRELALKMKEACAVPPTANFFDRTDVRLADGTYVSGERTIAPTLAKYLTPDKFAADLRDELSRWYTDVVKGRWAADESHEKGNGVKLFRLGEGLFPSKLLSPTADILATLLYPHMDSNFEELLSFACSLSHKQTQQAFKCVNEVRGEHDELPRAFRNQPYIFELTTDIGAYRDLHRHRRCQQFRQRYGTIHGYEIPQAVIRGGVLNTYVEAIDKAHHMFQLLWPSWNAAYILPFATRVRTLFKMDFAEAEYICKLRSKVGGHFSYRRLVWEMAEQLKQVEPYLGAMIQATHHSIEAPLCR